MRSDDFVGSDTLLATLATNGKLFETWNPWAVLLGWLSWAVLATPAHAQPEAMPITVLDNRDVLPILQPEPVMPGPYVPEPQPLVAPGSATVVRRACARHRPARRRHCPAESAGSASGRLDGAVDLASLARWADVQELSGRQ